MKSELIESFLAVTKYGSMSKSAEMLFISQPTLSNRIAELEKELGYKLFIRKKGVRYIQLTDHGHSFLTIAEEWNRLLIGTKRIGQIKPRENLRITVSHTLVAGFFADVLNLFLSRDLPVSLHIMSSSSLDAFRKVQNDEIDFAIVGNTINFVGVAAEALAREKIVFASGINSEYGDFVHTQDLDPKDEIYMNWGHDQFLWHQQCFGSDFLPIIRIESSTFAEAFLPGANIHLWMPLALSSARRMETIKRFKISELDIPIPSRVIYMVSKVPIKRDYHDLLMEDMLTVLQQKDAFTLVD